MIIKIKTMPQGNSLMHAVTAAFWSLVTMLASNTLAVSVAEVGRATSLNFQSYLQDEIDWSETKAYVVTDNTIQRWPMNGQRIAPENQVTWGQGTVNDTHQQFYVYDADRNVHITANHLTVYNPGLS